MMIDCEIEMNLALYFLLEMSRKTFKICTVFLSIRINFNDQDMRFLLQNLKLPYYTKLNTEEENKKGQIHLQ